MSNTLVRAAHSLGLAEKRIVGMAISRIDSRKARDPRDPLKIKITADEFAEEFGISANEAYRELKVCAKALMDRKIRFIQPSAKGDKITEMRWIGRATYHEGEAWVEVVFWHEVVPHLTLLSKSFTSYKLASASALRSVYSWRLLELFAQFKNTGLVTIDIADFVHAMDAPPSCRNDFGRIRARIVEPAIKELREKDGLAVEWETKKAGRKITGLVFRFKPDDQMKLF